MILTLTDLTIERGTAQWGGPTAKVTINAGPLAGESLWLRSTEGMESLSRAADLRKGGGVFVNGTDPDDRNSHHDWRGVYKTWDMDDAINRLVEYINEMSARRLLQDATWGEVDALSTAVSDLSDALNEKSFRDIRADWQRVQDAVAALDMKMIEFLQKEEK